VVSAGPAWLMNTMPGGHVSAARARAHYLMDSAGDREESTPEYNGYVGTLHDVFDVNLFNNIGGFASASGSTLKLSQRDLQDAGGGPNAPLAASTYTYAGGSAGAWFMTGNWTGGTAGTYPGAANAANPGNANDIALFSNTATSVGINFNAANGATLNLGAATVSGSTSMIIQNSSGTTGLGTRNLVFNGALAGNAAGLAAKTLLNASGANLTLNPGPTSGTVMGMQLGITDGSINADANRTIAINVVISEAAANSGFTKTGAGSLLSGANTYTGVTIIGAGRLSVSSLANGGVTSNIGASSNAASNLVLGGGGSLSSATLLYTGSGSSTDRLFTLDSGTNIFDSSGTGALSFTNTGTIAFSGTGARSLTLTGSNTGDNTIVSVLTDNPNGGGGVFSLLAGGGGSTWVLTNTNTYTGSTFLGGGGTLAFNNGSLGSGTIQFDGAATLKWNGTNTEDVSSRIKILDGNTATFNTNGNNVTFASALQIQTLGTAAVIKTGNGILTLSTANTYTSGTTVNGGTLLVNGGVFGTSSGTGSGTVTVNNGGTLGGNGNISGAVMVNSSGTLSPGSSAGILHTGALTLNSGSTYLVDVNGGSGITGTGAGSLYDQTIVNGALNIAGALSLTLGATPLAVGDKFFIATYTGSESGTFSNATGGTVYTQGADVFLINYTDLFNGGTAVSIEVTAIPEASTWIGTAPAVAAIGFTQRRRLRRLVSRRA
jgi:fibronectin-binding autotransporter adhesin